MSERKQDGKSNILHCLPSNVSGIVTLQEFLEFKIKTNFGVQIEEDKFEAKLKGAGILFDQQRVRH